MQAIISKMNFSSFSRWMIALFSIAIIAITFSLVNFSNTSDTSLNGDESLPVQFSIDSEEPKVDIQTNYENFNGKNYFSKRPNVPKYELTISAINDISQMCLPGFAQSTAFSTHLIFNHISRTGGTSLEKYLLNFAESCNLTSKNFFSYGCKRHSCELSSDEREEIKKTNILYGYQQFGVHSIFPKTVYITMLRHPVSVFVSIVFQAEANMLGQRKPLYSMEKCIELVRNALIARKGYRIDWIARLTGIVPAELDSEMEQATNIAKKNLAQFALVMINEFFQDSVKMLKNVIDPQNITKEVWTQDYHENSSPFPFTTSQIIANLPKHLLESIYSYTRYEIEIFEYGIELFHKRCPQYLAESRCKYLRKKNVKPELQ